MERIQLTGDFEAYKIPRCSDDQLLAAKSSLDEPTRVLHPFQSTSSDGATSKALNQSRHCGKDMESDWQDKTLESCDIAETNIWPFNKSFGIEA